MWVRGAVFHVKHRVRALRPVSTWKVTGDMAGLTITVTRRSDSVCITVSCPLSQSKRAARAAAREARAKAREWGRSGAYLRTANHSTRGGSFTYRAYYAIG